MLLQIDDCKWIETNEIAKILPREMVIELGELVRPLSDKFRHYRKYVCTLLIFRGGLGSEIITMHPRDFVDLLSTGQQPEI